MRIISLNQYQGNNREFVCLTETIKKAVVKSFWYNKLGAEGLLTKEIRSSRIRRLAKVRFLAPEILESILNGTQDPELTIKKLTEMANKID